MSFSNQGWDHEGFEKKHVGNPSHLELILWLGKVPALRQAKCHWAHDGASCDGPTEHLKMSPGSALVTSSDSGSGG